MPLNTIIIRKPITDWKKLAAADIPTLLCVISALYTKVSIVCVVLEIRPEFCGTWKNRPKSLLKTLPSDKSDTVIMVGFRNGSVM